jgi:RNA polymerase sigma factor (sigma-70 family)
MESFPLTRWTLIRQVKDQDSPEYDAALDSLCRSYWQPVFVFARSEGLNVEEAQDVTQAFLAHMIRQDFFGRFERERGRFRTFVLSCLRNFISAEWRRSTRKKRGSGQIHLPLDELPDLEHPATTTPDIAFERSFAQSIFNQVLMKLQAEMTEAGMAHRFDILKATLGREKGADYSELSAKLNLSAGALRTMISRFRARYRALFRAEVSSLVADPRDINDEMNQIIAALM